MEWTRSQMSQVTRKSEYKEAKMRGKVIRISGSSLNAQSRKPKDAKTRELISKVANVGIIEMVADDPVLKKAYLKRLDLSPASLKALDALINRIWAGGRPSDENLETMVWAYGAYVGTVIQRKHEGVWKKSKYYYDFKFTRDGVPTGFAVNPWSWTYKRFDENDLLAPKYEALMEMAGRFYEASASQNQA